MKKEKKAVGVAFILLIGGFLATSTTFSIVRNSNNEKTRTTTAVAVVENMDYVGPPVNYMVEKPEVYGPVVITIPAITTTVTPKATTQVTTTVTTTAMTTTEVVTEAPPENEGASVDQVGLEKSEQYLDLEPEYNYSDSYQEEVYQEEVCQEIQQSQPEENSSNGEFNWYYIPQDVDISTIEVNSDVYLLAYAMSNEASASDYCDARLVGEVILNRVDSSEFPNSVIEVIEEPGQYYGWPDSYYHNYPRENIIDDNYLKIAYDLVNNGNRNAPSDVVFQAQFIQGPVWKIVGVHYYCHRS